MTLPFGLDRTFSVSSPRNTNRRAASVAMYLVCFAVLAVACRTARATGVTAHFSWAIEALGGSFTNAWSVAVDGSGNVYVANGNSSAITKIPPGCGSASCTTQVGSGFSFPQGVAVDGSGNIYVADSGNNAVKEILAAGGYTTINTLGSGFNYPQGVAVDGSGNVYVADTSNNAVKEILAVGGYTTVNTLGSGFNAPTSVAVDGSGNVYVADWGNTLVKEILAAGGYTTVNTLGSGFSFPQGVAVDGSGNVYVADTNNNAVKEILAAGGYTTVNTLGSGFSFPPGVAVDGSGNVYVADRFNHAVKEIMTQGVSFGSAAVATTTPPTLPLTFTFDIGGSIGAPGVLTQGAAGKDFADAGTGTCTTNGTSHTYNAGDTCTVDVAFTPKYPGQRLGAVQLVNTNGLAIATANVYGTGTGPLVTFPGNTRANTIGTGFNSPIGVAVDGSGNVFIADFQSSSLKEIVAVNGAVSPSSVVNTIGSGSNFQYIAGVAVDGAGNVFVANQFSDTVNEIVAVNGAVSSGSTVNTIHSFGFPSGVAVDGAGNVFVTDTGTNAVSEIVAVDGVVSPSSTVNTIGSGFNQPYGVAVDGSGNVFVADQGNNAVKEIVAVNGVVSSSSTVNTIGSGFSGPSGIAVDGSGNIFVADTGNNVVKEILAVGGVVSSSSAVKTIGSGIGVPVGVAVDGSGNVFIADRGDFTVKKLDLSDPPSLNFATATNVGSTDTTDGPLTVTVANSGNAALSFTVPASGNNPSISANFTLDSTSGGTCPLTTGTPNTLAAGARCTLPISFAPTVAGTISGSLVLTDTHLNANPSTTQTISLNGTGVLLTPTLAFATIPAHTFGDTPFTVTATSASSGAVTYTVASGPATISGSTVTLTGAGTVVLSASQAATATYAAATATTSFTVGQAPPTDFSLGMTATSSQSIASGDTATFSFTIAPVGGTYPGTVSFTATGLPTGATATFSPASIAANGGAQIVVLTVKTSTQAKLEMPLSYGGGSIAFALLLLPLAGTKKMRRVARKLGRGTGVALLLLLSLGAVAGLSGCGGRSAKSYTIAVTATSGSSQHTTNFTLQVK